MGSSSALTAPTAAGLEELAEKAVHRARNSASANTLRAYNRQWNRFVGWCQQAGLSPCPADGRTVALFLTALDEAGLSVATMAQTLAAITKVHRNANRPPPAGRALEATWAGIRRSRGTAPQRRVKAIEVEDLRSMVEALGGDRLIDFRDRALLLVGFAGAFRRSELVGLRTDDLEWTDEGIVVRLRRSKTDQEGLGREVGVPVRVGRGLHPMQELKTWLELSGIEDGPLFRRVTRHGQVGQAPLTTCSVARVIKRTARRAGLDESAVSGHSLRAGLVTSAAKAGKGLVDIMAQTGHRSVTTVQGYVRRATLFENNAAADLS